MRTVDEQPPIEQKLLDLVTHTLGEIEAFAHKFALPEGISRELNIQTIWDLEAHELIEDFEVLTRSWRHLSFAEPLYALHNLVTAFVDRLQAKKAQGKKAIYGYEIRETLITSESTQSFSIIITTNGDTKGKATLKVSKTSTTQSIALDNDTKETLLHSIATTLNQLDNNRSNIPAITDTETLIQEMLAIIESRLMILRPFASGKLSPKVRS